MSRILAGELFDDRYQVTGSLGHGGMAQVYRAFDRHLERDVALKVLRPHLTEADSERFRREIMTLAKLSHPNIVSIYDLGRGEHVYFAMELVPGGTFTELGPLSADPEPLTHFLDAAVAVAEALAYVHRLGMVHRDLTPRNILLTPEGHPKVMDFGLVQLAEASRQLTRTGLTLGTPQYMAPEQAQGDVTGAHTDLYALGAVLYKTVTGVAPFEAENDLTLLYQHVYGTLISPQQLNPALPESLSGLISSLLAKNPRERPASGERVADALRSVKAEVLARSSGQRLGGPGQQGVLTGGPVDPGGLTQLWSVKLPAGPQWPGALTAAAGFVVLGCRSEEVVVLHPSDGSVQARFETDDEVNSAVLSTTGSPTKTGRRQAFLYEPGRERERAPLARRRARVARRRRPRDRPAALRRRPVFGYAGGTRAPPCGRSTPLELRQRRRRERPDGLRQFSLLPDRLRLVARRPSGRWWAL